MQTKVSCFSVAQVGAADLSCVVGRAGRVSCTEGVEVHQSTVFCLSETSSSVPDEEGLQLRALMVLFQVEEIDSRSYFQNSLKSDSLKVGFL